MKISVIVVTFNEGERLLSTVQQLLATLPEHSEIIVVDDGSNDGSADLLSRVMTGVRILRSNGIGAPSARNWGASQSKGDILIFCDAHLAFPKAWWKPLIEVLRDSSVGAVSPLIAVMGGRPEQKGFALTFTGADLQIRW